MDFRREGRASDFLFTFMPIFVIIKNMAESIREPKQKRSIEKKERIIRAGYDLFAEKGYFNTNTAEIAKAAGVSTGIVYGYFHDKRDILLEALDIYVRTVFTPIFSLLEELTDLDFDKIIPLVIEKGIAAHRENKAMHKTLHALSAEDEEVAERFAELEKEITQKLSEKLVSLGYPSARLYEKVHAAIIVVQSFAHEEVYDHHEYIDYNAMRALATEMLVKIF